MDTIIERVAGLDIGKKSLTACVRTPDGRGGRRAQTRTYSTMTRQLLALGEWLAAEQGTVVAMESTGTYWKPPFYVLEGCFECWLLNARHLKAVPGRKTDLLTELPDRCGGRGVRGRAGLARFPRRDQWWGCPGGA